MASIFSGITFQTESDVEQKFIYPLLTAPVPNGLGYLPEDIRTKIDIRKLKIDKGTKSKLYFPDYAIVVNGLPAAIVEAKTPGEDLNEALREARLYASEINASYTRNINPCQVVIATDGVALKASSWDKEDADIDIDIAKIDPLDATFAQLIDIASKKAISRNTHAILQSIKSTAVYFKPVQMLGGKSVENEVIGENSFGANVSIEYKYLFNPETLEDRASVAQNAYVTSNRKQSHIAPIDKIIRASFPTEIQARLIEDTGAPKELIEQVGNAARVKNEICLLIGGVGSGKSTFTDYIRLEALPPPLRDSTLWININLNRAPLDRTIIYKWIVQQSIQHLRETHTKIDFDSIEIIKKIYSREIGKVERGRASLYPKDSEKYIDAIYSEIERLQLDAESTLDGMINYLCTGSEKLFIIVLDNCDKRNRDDQLLMFEVASWLKERFACMVFLPLRDTTYDQYRNEPPLDTVIKDLVFRIDPPLLERVIYKRLNYALRVIQNQKNKFVYFLPKGMKVECGRDEVATYIQAIISSLFQDNFFKRIITGLAGKNIRKGLEILLDFCKSGHISEEELLKCRQSHGEYKLPHFLVARIILKGKRKYYSDNESNLKNLFSCNPDDSLPNPFIRLAILAWLKQNSREYGPNRTKGFHKVSSLIAFLQASGHTAERAFIELSELIASGCIISETQTSEITNEDLVSISPSGLIHLDLVHNIEYLATIAEDVYFRENQPAKKIADNLIGKGPFKIDSRQSAISNSQLLTNYLKSYYSKFFIGPAKILNDEVSEDLINIDAIVSYVDRTSSNDETFKRVNKFETDYPEGTEIDAQIVSTQNYGIFVEFGLEGRGLVRKNQQPQSTFHLFDTWETGDWVRVKVGKYIQQHNGFSLTLA
ncbi:type I restriction endonuclease [Pseudomonas mosselii]|uniref:type I restriction endonuclease n=1 Tax=Pseudomonas mosselii TaxID=78327 RepID=UPI001F4C0F8B|nr:type I restriction endonuclease [Pseudomonas mosselii]MCH7419611.1 type I restriction endonuclease [Pseudomonas mosselii]